LFIATLPGLTLNIVARPPAWRDSSAES